MAKKGKGRHRKLKGPHYLTGKAPKPVRTPLPTGPYAPAVVIPIDKDRLDGDE